MKIFSERLKELREEKRYSQRHMASLLNLAQQSYLRYELNTAEPSLQTLANIADIFGVTAGYLLGLED